MRRGGVRSADAQLAAVFPGFDTGEGLDALRALIGGEVGQEVRHLAQALSEETVEGGEAADTLHDVTAYADDVSALGWSAMERFNAEPGNCSGTAGRWWSWCARDCLSAACWWSY